jgi:hypothetical protein
MVERYGIGANTMVTFSTIFGEKMASFLEPNLKIIFPLKIAVI